MLGQRAIDNADFTMRVVVIEGYRRGPDSIVGRAVGVVGLAPTPE